LAMATSSCWLHTPSPTYAYRCWVTICTLLWHSRTLDVWAPILPQRRDAFERDSWRRRAEFSIRSERSCDYIYS
jgi:hypothetical protein